MGMSHMWVTPRVGHPNKVIRAAIYEASDNYIPARRMVGCVDDQAQGIDPTECDVERQYVAVIVGVVVTLDPTVSAICEPTIGGVAASRV